MKIYIVKVNFERYLFYRVTTDRDLPQQKFYEKLYKTESIRVAR